MSFLKAVFFIIVFAGAVSCSKGGNLPLEVPPQVQPEPEEKNIVLATQEIELMTLKDHDDLKKIRPNILELERHSVPESIYKDFTFPAKFAGLVEFAWLYHSAVKDGDGSNTSSSCNDSALVALGYTVINSNGNKKSYQEDQVARIHTGDILRVSIDTKNFDCTTFTTAFTATIVH